MAEQSGPSVAAIQAKQAVLADRYGAAAEADQILAEVTRSGYAGSVAARRQLDTIAAEIGACVQDSATFPAATPLGAREFQRLLLSKQREIIAIVVDAQQDASTKRQLLEALPARYPRFG